MPTGRTSPDRTFEYTETNYLLLGLVIEQLGGRPSRRWASPTRRRGRGRSLSCRSPVVPTRPGSERRSHPRPETTILARWRVVRSELPVPAGLLAHGATIWSGPRSPAPAYLSTDRRSSDAAAGEEPDTQPPYSPSVCGASPTASWRSRLRSRSSDCRGARRTSVVTSTRHFHPAGSSRPPNTFSATDVAAPHSRGAADAPAPRGV